MTRAPFSTGDAVALSSPSGRMSKRARKVAEQQLGNALFGPGSGFEGWEHIPSAAQRRADRILVLRSRLADFRHLDECQPNRRVWKQQIAKVIVELNALGVES